MHACCFGFWPTLLSFDFESSVTGDLQASNVILFVRLKAVVMRFYIIVFEIVKPSSDYLPLPSEL